jgi:hypothetical protein
MSVAAARGVLLTAWRIPMSRLTLLVAALLVLMSTSAANAEDKLVGAAWAIKFDATGKESVLRFRTTPDGKVYDRGQAAIGSWKDNSGKVEMEVTGLKEKQDRFNGKYVLTQISNDEKAPRWSGKWTPPGGTRSKNVQVQLLKN